MIFEVLILSLIQKEYLNIKINIEDIPQLRIRKAKQEELKSLKTIALKIVKNMNANGLQLWNEYYPAEELKGLIEQEKLYVCEEDNNIVSFFALFDDEVSSSSFK